MSRSAKPWRRNHGPWYAWVNGRQVRLADPSASHADARQELHRLLAAGGSAGAPPIRAKELFRLFLSAAEGVLAPRTVEDYREGLGGFAATLGNELASELKPLHVQRWFDRRGAKWCPSTRKRQVSPVKRACAWGVEQGYLDADPLARVKGGSGGRREKVMTESQARSVIEHYPPSDPFRPFLEFLMETGCRPGEAARLTAAQVDIANRAAVLSVHKTGAKTGRPRTIYLAPRALAILRPLVLRHPEGPLFRSAFGTPWDRKSCHRRLRRLKAREGWGPEVCCYAFRHVFATSALERGVPIAVVAELLGHTSTAMVSRHYGHLGDRREFLLREAERAAG